MVDHAESRERVLPEDAAAHADAIAEWPVPAIALANVSPVAQDLFHALRTTTGLHRGLLERMLAQHDSHTREALCLRVIANEEGISQRELATMMQRSRSWISEIVESLENQGALERRGDKDDRRVSRLYLTARGRERKAELDEVLRAFLDLTIGALSEEDQIDLTRLLRKLAQQSCNIVGDGDGVATQLIKEVEPVLDAFSRYGRPAS